MKNILLVIVWAFLLVGCWQAKVTPVVSPTETEKTIPVPVKTTPEQPAPKPTAKTYTATEVSLHNSKSDCWLILEGKVYNVTKFIPMHPGRDAIVAGCGKDATSMFDAVGHPERVKEMRENYYIGDVK